MQRRAFLAAGAVSIPSIALAGGVSLRGGRVAGIEFHDLMEQAGKHLKSMRGMLEDLDMPGHRDDAAFLANQITILLAQSVMVADQVAIPERSVKEYDGDKEQFTKDLQVKLTHAVAESSAFCRELILGNDDEAISLYGSLRKIRKEGHNEFVEDD